MKSRIISLLSFFLVSGFLFTDAEEKFSPDAICPKLTIFFTNGVKNTREEASSNLLFLRKSILEDHFNNDIHTKVGNYRYTDLRFCLNYNQTAGLAADVMEVFEFDDLSDDYDEGLSGYIDRHENALYSSTVPVATEIIEDRGVTLVKASYDLDLRSTSYWSLIRQYLENNADANFRQLVDDKLKEELAQYEADLVIETGSASSLALDSAGHLQAYLEEYKARRKIITVAHSEGNFFANLEHQAIEAFADPKVQESMAIVSVGTPDSKVEGYSSLPESERYITLDEDFVIWLARLSGGYGASAFPGNWSVLNEGVEPGYYSQNENLGIPYRVIGNPGGQAPEGLPLPEFMTAPITINGLPEFNLHGFSTVYMYYPGSRDFIINKVFELADGVERPAALQGDEIESRFYLETDENGDTFASKTEFNLQDPLPLLPRSEKWSLSLSDPYADRESLNSVFFGPTGMALGSKAPEMAFYPGKNRTVFRASGSSNAFLRFTSFKYVSDGSISHKIELLGESPQAHLTVVSGRHLVGTGSSHTVVDSGAYYSETIPSSFELEVLYEEHNRVSTAPFIAATYILNGQVIAYDETAFVSGTLVQPVRMYLSIGGEVSKLNSETIMKTHRVVGGEIRSTSEYTNVDNWNIVELGLSPELKDIDENVEQKEYSYDIVRSDGKAYDEWGDWWLVRGFGKSLKSHTSTIKFVFDRATQSIYNLEDKLASSSVDPRLDFGVGNIGRLSVEALTFLARSKFDPSQKILQELTIGNTKVKGDAYGEFVVEKVTPRVFEPYVDEKVQLEASLLLVGVDYSDEKYESVRGHAWDATVEIVNERDDVLYSFELDKTIAGLGYSNYRTIEWDGTVERDRQGRDLVDLRDVHQLFFKIDWALYEVKDNGSERFDGPSVPDPGSGGSGEGEGNFDLVCTGTERVEIMHPCLTE